MKIKNDKIVIQVICALVAVGLWMLVMIDKNPMGDRTFNKIPVTINNIEALNRGDTKYVIMNDSKAFTVNVSVKGLYEDLLKLQSKDIKAAAEITDFNEGSNSFVVEIELPKDMELKTVSPRYITCTIEEIVSVPVDVYVQYEGSQATGYHLGKYGASNPETVFVQGPRSIVNSVSSAVVVVNVEGQQENVTQKKPVKLYDNTNKVIDMKYLTITPGSVEASYEIQPTKTVPIKPIIIGEPAEGFKLTDISADLDTVVIAAPKEILDTITELETEPLDITGASINMMSEKKIIVGKDVNIVGNANKTNVSATIEKVVEKQFEFSFEDIEFANKGQGYIITPEDENQTFLVTVTAPSSIINKLIKEDIKIKVDLINAIDGLNELGLTLDTSADIDSITINNEVIRFNLEKASTLE